MIIIIPLISSGFLLIPNRTIKIKPKSHPEIYFFASAGTIPTDKDFLKLCAENNIGFAISIRKSYIEGNTTLEKRKFQDLLESDVNVYIVIGGDEDYFLTMKNGDEFYDYFKYIRDWVANIPINNSEYPLAYNHPKFNGFLVDAEPLIDILEDKGFVERYQYFLSDIPKEERIDEVKKQLDNMIEAIHDSNKEIGIIKPLSVFDELDGDYDYSLLTKTIYSIELEWDLSISMIYRTRYQPDIYDYLMFNLREYSNDVDTSTKSGMEKDVLPLSTFYTKVSFELDSDEIELPRDKKYMFIGTFHKDFEDTSYIEDYEYLNDIDILRHFDIDKIFIYDWDDFKERYDGSLKYLIERLSQDDEWNLILPSYILSKEIAIIIFITFLDRSLFI